MAGYLSSRKLTNVSGRIQYINDPKRQENILDYYNTTDDDFWKILAKECQVKHKESHAGGKCCEARELIIGLPQDFNITAQQICDIFKNKYNVECSCAIHQNDKSGTINKHCHLIFSERKKLNEPQIVEEKRATRTYYYDAKGNKCKKADAVKVVSKGTILKKGIVTYFSEKNTFFKSQKFVYDCKELFLKETLQLNWSLENELKNKELSVKHIGKNNPKTDYIKQNNNMKSVLKEICKTNDFILQQEDGFSLKKLKEYYNIKSFSAVVYENNIKPTFAFIDDVQSTCKKVIKDEVYTHNGIVDDVYSLQYEDSIYPMIHRQIIPQYENEAKTKDRLKIIDFLKDKLIHIVNRIKKLIDIQNTIQIEPKNQISIEQDKTNDKLYIIDKEYVMEQEHQMENDELELDI